MLRGKDFHPAKQTRAAKLSSEHVPSKTSMNFTLRLQMPGSILYHQILDNGNKVLFYQCHILGADRMADTANPFKLRKTCPGKFQPYGPGVLSRAEVDMEQCGRAGEESIQPS